MSTDQTVLYIYALYDPRDDKVRYVGVTDNPEARLNEHMHSRSERVRDWVYELQKSRVAPRLRILEIPVDPHSAEIYWIQKCEREGASLLNVALRRTATYGYQHTPVPLPSDIATKEYTTLWEDRYVEQQKRHKERLAEWVETYGEDALWSYYERQA